ncbi:hypothetical protein [Oceaniglobus trochenteri]|uniref:hypothetical protein n=1 Tax=Oceaniglobus trochenteri TaxID=2763260 RepID=UPI001CFFB380|nr:hypothetical protein [Oceaniglobus trochenteri]
MSQNRSSAVMQQRREAHDSLDDFPTPPWATRALCEWLAQHGALPAHLTCREPAANRGHMVAPLKEVFASVEASDVHDYGAGFPLADYLMGAVGQVDWTITNPPFRLAQPFIQQALRSSRCGVAMILRTAFLEGVGRHRDLFSVTPPTDILQFSERVVMHRGRLSAKGSSATAYCWVVWRKTVVQGRTAFRWIAPCRARLERAGDYPPEANPAPPPPEGALLFPSERKS